MATDELTDWERRHAKRGRRALAWAGGFVLLAGILLAAILPAAKGTCGLPPFGTDEFCRGNDRSANAIVFFVAVGLSAVLFALGSRTRRAIFAGAAVVLACGIAAAAAVHPSYKCPPGLLLNYYANRVGPSPPVCTSLALPTAVNRSRPALLQ